MFWMKQYKWEQFVSVDEIMSSASGKMPHEVIFPMEFFSVFQDNIALLRYSLCCMWKVWNRSSFHLHHKPEIWKLVFLKAWNIILNLISSDMKVLLRTLTFNAVDLWSNPSCRNVFAAILTFYLFRKPNTLNSSAHPGVFLLS